MITQWLQTPKNPVGICADQSTGDQPKTGGQGQGRTTDLPLFRLAAPRENLQPALLANSGPDQHKS